MRLRKIATATTKALRPEEPVRRAGGEDESPIVEVFYPALALSANLAVGSQQAQQ